ncbi:hypothetical protein DV735_g4736, partial [Chaetothyriales sp. CBS 134920]
MTDPASQEEGNGSSEAAMMAMMGFSSFTTSGSKAGSRTKAKGGANREPLPPRKQARLDKDGGNRSPAALALSNLPPPPELAPAAGAAGIASPSSITPTAGVDTIPTAPTPSTTSINTAIATTSASAIATTSASAIATTSASAIATTSASGTTIPPLTDQNSTTITHHFPGGGYSFVTAKGDVGFFSQKFIIDDPWMHLRELIK